MATKATPATPEPAKPATPADKPPTGEPWEKAAQRIEQYKKSRAKPATDETTKKKK